MSGISVSWSDGDLHLGCVFDPQKPARLLEHVLPSWTPPSDRRVVPQLRRMAAPGVRSADREEAHAVFAQYFRKVIDGLREDADAGVVLLGPVDRLVLIPPHMAAAGAVKRLAELVERASGTETVAVSGASAVLASADGLLRPGGVYVVCHWADDLSVFCARPAADLRTLERVSRMLVLRGIGAASLQAAMRAAGRAPARDDDGRERGDEIAARWTQRANGFLTAAFRELVSLHPQAAVVSGTSSERLPVVDVMQRVAVAHGLPACVTNIEDEHAGAHVLCPGRPLMPYDCGVVIRRPGASFGAGSLVLIRPESIGTRRVSDVLEHPAEPGEVLEVAAYIRRVDFVEKRVTYELLDNKTFAARPDEYGAVRLTAAMSVGGDDEAYGDATVTIDIEDLGAGGHIVFRDLPLRAKERIWRPPALSGAAIDGANWALRMIERASGTMDGRSIEDWISLFRVRELRTRTQYAAAIIDIAGVAGGSILREPSFIRDAEPEAFQAAARAMLFAGLCELAESHPRIPAVVAWTAAWPAGSLPRDTRAAGDLVNALSAGGAEREATERAAWLLRMYELALAPASHLNIDW